MGRRAGPDPARPRDGAAPRGDGGTVRVGIVGCGRVVRTRHLPALAALDGVSVVALADADGDRASALAGDHGISRRGTDAAALIDDASIDLLLVAAPPDSHAAVAVPALEAGRHVFCEKPLAISAADARAIRDAAARSSGRFTLGLNLRSHRLYRVARDILRAGEVGRLAAIRSAYTARIRLDGGLPAWRDDPARGGALTEIGTHHLDLWRFLTGMEIDQVSARLRPGPGSGEADHTAFVRATLEDGTTATGLFSEATREGQELEAWGDRARLRVNGYRFDGVEVDPIDSYDADLRRRAGRFLATLAQLPRAVRTRRHGGDFVASYRAHWEHFLGVVRQGGEPRGTAEDGYRAVLAVLAARRSAAEAGRAVRLAEIEDSPGGP